MAAGAAALHLEPHPASASSSGAEPSTQALPQQDSSRISIEGHHHLAAFDLDGETWKAYEDFRTRDGVLTFVSAKGPARVLRKSAEAVFPEDGPQYLGLSLREIGLAGPDLLADRLLAGGDPDETQVRRAAPPMDSAEHKERGYRPKWNTIVGTRECSDTMPVYPAGSTRTYHPIQYFAELTNDLARKRHEGLIGGWMPTVRKLMPAGDNAWYEIVVFADVTAKDRFIVQTWHRTALIKDGVIARVEYGYSYPAYTRHRQPPKPEDYYRALLRSALYWDHQLADLVSITLPDQSWSDMVSHAFAKELIVRPGGVYPKYGAVDRDYYGPEYDGFQDIFTMSLYANLECGRFQQARDVFDNYFTSFTDDEGLINMRGPETAQFGLTLSLIARYYRYTGDHDLLARHRRKIEATATLLEELHEESLQLPMSDRGYGLIHGWCESDSCLMPNPAVWNKPYFANSAFAIRGWRDLASVWQELNWSREDKIANWRRRSDTLQSRLHESVAASIDRSHNPPYIGPLPGTTTMFRESLAKDHPSEQQWPHRCYAEMLQPAVLPDEQTSAIIDCMRAYGGTTLGVVANVEPAHPTGRDILGFISYGYAQALLRLDRIEEYLLFLYAHRYHDHSRGSWTAGEVSGITGDDALFCIPAQQTIPLLVRWMLVFEDPDADRLYFGRAIPRAWLATAKPIAIHSAPTRWGRVNYTLTSSALHAIAKIDLSPTAHPPAEIQVTFRLPAGKTLSSLRVNGAPVQPAGRHNEAALVPTHCQRAFEVVAEWT
jgi:hypothetical protein